jgi:hypothetical protein
MGARLLTFAGVLILSLGTWEFKNLSVDSTAGYVTIINSIRTLGIGLAMMPMTTAGMNTIPQLEVGRASALNNVCRQVAGSFSIAILTSVMQSRQTFHFAHLAESVNTSSPALPSMLKQISALLETAAGSGQSSALSYVYALAAKQSLVSAINDTFIVAAIFAAAALPATLLLGSRKNKNRPKTVIADKSNNYNKAQ